MFVSWGGACLLGHFAGTPAADNGQSQFDALECAKGIEQYTNAMKKNTLLSGWVVAITLVAAIATPGMAGVLTLHNTGEGLSQGDLDPNWTVTLPDGSSFGSAISATDPNNGWIAPTPPNTWISVAGRDAVPLGLYQYSTTFTIGAGFDPATATISGHWWADDQYASNEIDLNGVKVSDFDGAIYNESNAANALFSISSGFVAGLNTLTFRVENTGGPGGLLIQDLTGSVSPIPEPASVFAGSVACLAFGLIHGWSRRRRTP